MHRYNVIWELDGKETKTEVDADTVAHAAFSVGVSVEVKFPGACLEGRVRLLDVITLR